MGGQLFELPLVDLIDKSTQCRRSVSIVHHLVT